MVISSSSGNIFGRDFFFWFGMPQEFGLWGEKMHLEASEKLQGKKTFNDPPLSPVLKYVSSYIFWKISGKYFFIFSKKSGQNSRSLEQAKAYKGVLNDILEFPTVHDGAAPTYNMMMAMVNDRDHLMRELNKYGIETKIHYPILMPLHTAYRQLYLDCDIPLAKRIVSEIVSIPNHEDLTDSEVEYVADCIRAFGWLICQSRKIYLKLNCGFWL